MRQERPIKCVECGTQTLWGKVEATFEYHGVRLTVTGIKGMVCPQCGRQYVPGPEAVALSEAAEEVFQAQEALPGSGRVA